MTEALKYATKLSFAGTAIEFVSCDLSTHHELISDTEGIRGTRSMVLERATQGLIHCGGAIRMNPTPSELALILPYTLGANSLTLSDSMADVSIIKDLITASETYTASRVNKLMLHGSPGKKLDLTVDVVAKAVTMGSGGVVSGTPDISSRPLMMQDMGSGVTIGGTTYSVEEATIMVDNHISPTFMQGQTATDLEPIGRTITLTVKLKYTSTEAGLLTTAQSGPVLASPVTGSIAFTNGSHGVSFSFGALVATPETVKISDPKLRMPLTFTAYRVGTTLEMVTTTS